VLIPAASLYIPDQYWFKNLKARLVRSGQICCCASKEKKKKLSFSFLGVLLLLHFGCIIEPLHWMCENFIPETGHHHFGLG
jgi:hypothetical protein